MPSAKFILDASGAGESSASIVSRWIEAFRPGFQQLTDVREKALVVLSFIATVADSSFEANSVTAVRPFDGPLEQFHQLPLHQKLNILARNDISGGLNCAGVVNLLVHAVQDLLGVPIWEISVGDPASLNSHTVVLIELDQEVFVFDALYGAYLGDPATGEMLPYEQVMSLLAAGRADQVAMVKPTAFDRDFWAFSGIDLPEQAVHTGDIAENGSVRFRIPDFDPALFTDPGTAIAATNEWLVSQGLPPDFKYIYLRPFTIQQYYSPMAATESALAAIEAGMTFAGVTPTGGETSTIDGIVRPGGGSGAFTFDGLFDGTAIDADGEERIANWIEAFAPGYSSLSEPERLAKLLSFAAAAADLSVGDAEVASGIAVTQPLTTFSDLPLDVQLELLLSDYPGGGLDATATVQLFVRLVKGVEGWRTAILVVGGTAAVPVVLVEAGGSAYLVDPVLGAHLGSPGGVLSLDRAVQKLLLGEASGAELASVGAGKDVWLTDVQLADNLPAFQPALTGAAVRGAPDAVLAHFERFGADVLDAAGLPIGDVRAWLAQSGLSDRYETVFLQWLSVSQDVAWFGANARRQIIDAFAAAGGRQAADSYASSSFGDGTDLLYGAPGDDLLIGGGGHDALAGRGGEDTLDGSEGDDHLIGGGGGDLLRGGAGRDFARYDDAPVGVSASLDDSTPLTGAAAGDVYESIENLVGSVRGDDTLSGNAEGNELHGLAGDDRLDGRGGGDTLLGGAGDDTYVVAGLGDVLIELAGEGVDTVRSSADYGLGAWLDNLVLGAGALSGTGNSASNRLVGNDGDNRLDGREGADTLVGGAGDDAYVVDSAEDQVEELSEEGVDVVHATTHYILSDNIETLRLYGWSLRADGNAQNNSLFGTDGHDTLDGGGGQDTLVGGAGDEVYFVDGREDTIVEREHGGIDSVYAEASFGLGAWIENLVLTGDAREGMGNSASNRLVGNATANKLDGRAGVDTLEGGGGDDVYVADRQDDHIVEFEGEGRDTVYASVSFGLGAWLEDLVLTGSAHAGTGNDAANRMTGNSAFNRLDGLGGVDTLVGGGGDDEYVVDDALDLVVETAGDGNDTVHAVTSYQLPEHVEVLRLYGAGAVGKGGAAANALFGGAGADILEGGGGDDTLWGAGGDDVLTGGAGADLFAFGVGLGRDTVTDFEAGKDRIDLWAYRQSGIGWVAEQSGPDIHVQFANGDLLVLLGVPVSALTPSGDGFG